MTIILSFSIILLICLIFYIIFNLNASPFTYGDIISSKHSLSKSGNLQCNNIYHNICFPIIEYNVDGHIYKKMFRVNTNLLKKNLKIGNKLKLFYDYYNPNNATIAYPKYNNFSRAIFMILFFVIFVLLMLYIYFKYKGFFI